MKKLLSIFVLLVLVFYPAVAGAVTVDSGLGNTLELGSADLASTVIKIIQWVLGLLGLIAVVAILAGIVIAATSGDSDRGDKARRAIIAAIIGLVIVLIAWAIVTFVINTGHQLTNG